MWRWTKHSLLMMILTCMLGLYPVQAQQNLLQNPGFESDYSGRMGRGDFNFPAGWDGWWTDAPSTEAWMNVPPTGYPHSGPFRRSGTNSQSIAKGAGTFTAAAIQRVQDIPAGAVVRGSVWVYIENAEGSNAQVRIGVGSNVGTNVYGDISWSGWERRLNGLHQISVEHVATGGEVTIFIYATQTWPNDPNAVYFDDAELVIVGQGDASTDDNSSDDNQDTNTDTQPEAPPQPGGVAFVVPQDSSDDDGIIHTVGSGDTLSSIAVAYGVSVTEILELNGLSRSSFLQLGQELIIATPDPQQAQAEETEAVDDTDDSDVEVVTTEEVEEVAEETTEPRETIEVSGAIIEEPPSTPTDVPTETPAESPTPSNTPTETPIPDTATPAPPAPVTEADVNAVDPTSIEPGICIGMFEDDNQNGVLDTNEGYLAEGMIVLNDSEGSQAESYLTDGESEPFCIEELASGRYTLNGTAPEDYGLTTSPILRVNLEDGETVTVLFGARQGLEVLAIPTVDIQPTTTPPETGATSDDQSDLTEFSGLIVFGLAGAVLVLGFGASLLMRRR